MHVGWLKCRDGAVEKVQAVVAAFSGIGVCCVANSYNSHASSPKG